MRTCAAARIGLVALAAAAATRPSAAEDAAHVTFLDAAVQVCPALLMRPDKGAGVLASLGFEEKDAKGLGANWTMRTYQRKDTGTGVMTAMVTWKRFADATSRSCQLTAIGQAQAFDLPALRTRLEADPDIGCLDGDIATNLAGLMKKTDEGAAVFKRPGNDPLVIIHVTRTSRMSFVSMSRTDFGAGPRK